MVICLERGADCLHMVQLMPLHPNTSSPLAPCLIKIQTGFTLLVRRLSQVVVRRVLLVTDMQWRCQDFVTGVEVRYGSIGGLEYEVVLSVYQRGSLLDGLVMYLSCDTKKLHDNESTHILHNFWTSTHRGESFPPPQSPPLAATLLTWDVCVCVCVCMCVCVVVVHRSSGVGRRHSAAGLNVR